MASGGAARQAQAQAQARRLRRRRPPGVVALAAWAVALGALAWRLLGLPEQHAAPESAFAVTGRRPLLAARPLRGGPRPRPSRVPAAAGAAVGRRPLFAARPLRGGPRPRPSRVPAAAGAVIRQLVDPKLKMLLESDDYRQFITWARRLETEGHLQTMLTNMVELFEDTDVMELASGPSRGPTAANELVRDSWNKIWPEGLNATEKNRGFSLVMSFWRRLDQTRLFERVLADVVPSSGGRAGLSQEEKGEDAIENSRVLTDSEEQRVVFFESKLGESSIMKQYVKQSEGDEDVKALGPVVKPFFFKYLRSLELKIANQTIENEGWQSIGIVALLLVSLVVTVRLGFGGVDEDSLPAMTKPTVDRAFPTASLEEIEKLAAEEQAKKEACEAGDLSACPERRPTVEELQIKNAGKSGRPKSSSRMQKGPAALEVPSPDEEAGPDLRSPEQMARDQLSTLPRVGVPGGLSGQYGASGSR